MGHDQSDKTDTASRGYGSCGQQAVLRVEDGAHLREEGVDPLGHLRGGLLGEGEGQDVPGADAGAKKGPEKAPGEGVGLSRSGSRSGKGEGRVGEDRLRLGGEQGVRGADMFFEPFQKKVTNIPKNKNA